MNTSYLSIYCSKGREITMPHGNIPYLYFIPEGAIRLHTPSGIVDYSGGQYSISAIDTPLSGQVLVFPKSGVFLAVVIKFTPEEVISVLLDIGGNPVEQILNSALPSDITANSERRIAGAIARLLIAESQPALLAFMGKHIKRELIFHALYGSQGKQFLQNIIAIQQAGDIYGINAWIKENYRTTFTIEELARRLNIGVSTFHQKFKTAVGMGPLQCQKKLRLTEARKQMLDGGATVTEAAFDVGYKSLSQFNHDYKRIFGAPPREDILTLGKMLKGRAKIEKCANS